MFHKQPKSLLRRVLKGFSASNYCIAPRLWRPDGWDHAGVPQKKKGGGGGGGGGGRPGGFSAGAVLVLGCFAIYVTRD